MVKSKTQKKVGLSNYIILISIFVIVIIAIFVIRNIYLTNENNKLNDMVLTDVLTNKINIDEMDNYILENPETIIYVSLNNDDNSRRIEETVKKYINKNSLSNEIIYLNINKNEKDKFLKKINNKYMNNNKIDSLPVVLSFMNGKVNKFVENENIEENFNSFIVKTRAN